MCSFVYNTFNGLRSVFYVSMYYFVKISETVSNELLTFNSIRFPLELTFNEVSIKFLKAPLGSVQNSEPICLWSNLDVYSWFLITSPSKHLESHTRPYLLALTNSTRKKALHLWTNCSNLQVPGRSPSHNPGSFPYLLSAHWNPSC